MFSIIRQRGIPRCSSLIIHSDAPGLRGHESDSKNLHQDDCLQQTPTLPQLSQQVQSIPAPYQFVFRVFIHYTSSCMCTDPLIYIAVFPAT